MLNGENAYLPQGEFKAMLCNSHCTLEGPEELLKPEDTWTHPRLIKMGKEGREEVREERKKGRNPFLTFSKGRNLKKNAKGQNSGLLTYLSFQPGYIELTSCGGFESSTSTLFFLGHFALHYI